MGSIGQKNLFEPFNHRFQKFLPPWIRIDNIFSRLWLVCICIVYREAEIEKSGKLGSSRINKGIV